jgi:hypothetical protein
MGNVVSTIDGLETKSSGKHTKNNNLDDLYNSDFPESRLTYNKPGPPKEIFRQYNASSK